MSRSPEPRTTFDSRFGGVLAGLVAYILLLLPQRALAEAPTIDPDGNGTDLWSNIAPADLGGRADQFPLSRWKLDYHVDAVSGGVGLGGVDLDLSGVPALVLHAVAGVFWQFHVELTKGVLTLFAWAFGTNLLDPRYGVLAPVAQVTTDLHKALGAWTTVAVLALGGALSWRLFVRGDVSGTVGQLVLTIAATSVALLLINSPAWTAQFASGIARETSGGLLSATNAQTAGASKDPRIRATDALWTTLVADPWTVLQFGGIEHCVDAKNQPAKPGSPDCRKSINHRTKYVDAFLEAGNANGGTRTALYEAIATGKAPDDERIQELKADERQVKAFKVSDVDKPAADLMGRSGAEDRLAVTPLIFLGALGANLMIGLMAATQLIMQVYFLLLLTLAAVMFLAALIPGRPQKVFRSWIERLIGALVQQVIIALLLGVAVAIAAALTNAGGQLGWLFVFVAQGAFWWALFFYRGELQDAIAAAAPGQAGARGREESVGSGLAHAYYAGKRRLGRGPRYSPPPPPRDGGGRGTAYPSRGPGAPRQPSHAAAATTTETPGAGPTREELTADPNSTPTNGSGNGTSPTGPVSTARPTPDGDEPSTPTENGTGGSPPNGSRAAGEGREGRPLPSLDPTADASSTGGQASPAEVRPSANGGGERPTPTQDGSDCAAGGRPPTLDRTPQDAWGGVPATLPAAGSSSSLEDDIARDRKRVQPLRDPTPPSPPAGPPAPPRDGPNGSERPSGPRGRASRRRPRRLPPDGPPPGGLEPPHPPQSDGER